MLFKSTVLAVVSLLPAFAAAEEILEGVYNLDGCEAARCARVGIDPSDPPFALASLNTGDITTDSKFYEDILQVLPTDSDKAVLCQTCLPVPEGTAEGDDDDSDGVLNAGQLEYQYEDLRCQGYDNSDTAAITAATGGPMNIANDVVSLYPEFILIPASFWSISGSAATSGSHAYNDWCKNNFEDFLDPCCKEPTSSPTEAPTLAPTPAPTPAPTSAPTTKPKDPCFSETATVEVKEIGKVTMKALQVGDVVLTPSGYEKVYTIDHRSEDQMAEFIQIYTFMEEPLEITANHLIYVQGKKDPVKASSVIVGDKLQGFFEGEMKSVEVESISSISKRGLYNPITESGSIVVNGLVTSTYTAVDISSGSNYVEIAGFKVLSIHDFLHLAMVPFKTVCMSLPNANVCSIPEGKEHNSYDELGLQLMSFGKSQNIIMQNAILLSILTILCSINIISSPVVFVSMFLFRTFRKQK